MICDIAVCCLLIEATQPASLCVACCLVVCFVSVLLLRSNSEFDVGVRVHFDFFVIIILFQPSVIATSCPDLVFFFASSRMAVTASRLTKVSPESGSNLRFAMTTAETFYCLSWSVPVIPCASALSLSRIRITRQDESS